MLFLPNMDKLVHGFLFFVLTLLWGLSRKGAVSLQFALFMALVGGAYGLVLEYYQEYVLTFRGFEWEDVVADTAGALIGSLWIWRTGWKYKVTR